MQRLTQFKHRCCGSHPHGITVDWTHCRGKPRILWCSRVPITVHSSLLRSQDIVNRIRASATNVKYQSRDAITLRAQAIDYTLHAIYYVCADTFADSAGSRHLRLLSYRHILVARQRNMCNSQFITSQATTRNIKLSRQQCTVIWFVNSVYAWTRTDAPSNPDFIVCFSSNPTGAEGG